MSSPPAPGSTPSTPPARAVTGGSVAGGARPRDPDLILARVHLRLGSLSLARTELETLAGRGTLDDDAIRDLAEARWRTGDSVGAGEAATAWLEGHPDDVLGLVIAAEAQSTLGRPGEARRLAGRALERADGSLDPLFAGMQRSSIWPVEPGASVRPVGVLFDDLHPGPLPVDPLPPGSPIERRPNGYAALRDAAARDELEGRGAAAGPAGPSLWGDEGSGHGALDAEALDAPTLFHRARVALESGDASDAATGLILALRASPALAPAVLDLLSGRSESILALVRGDAQRIVGREVEALRDHAVAAGGLVDVDPDAPDDAEAATVATGADTTGDAAGDGDATGDAGPIGELGELVDGDEPGEAADQADPEADPDGSTGTDRQAH